MGGEKLVTWEQLLEKKYWIYNTAEDWEEDTPGLRNFYEDPEKFPLGTPTGKLEFYSESLEKAFPDDMERPPIPKWIEKVKTMMSVCPATGQKCSHALDVQSWTMAGSCPV